MCCEFDLLQRRHLVDEMIPLKLTTYADAAFILHACASYSMFIRLFESGGL